MTTFKAISFFIYIIIIIIYIIKLLLTWLTDWRQRLNEHFFLIVVDVTWRHMWYGIPSSMTATIFCDSHIWQAYLVDRSRIGLQSDVEKFKEVHHARPRFRPGGPASQYSFQSKGIHWLRSRKGISLISHIWDYCLLGLPWSFQCLSTPFCGWR